MADAVLVLNAGSSSIKFALFDSFKQAVGTQPTLFFKGQVEGIGTTPHFTAKDPVGSVLANERWSDAGSGHHVVLPRLLAWVEAHLGGNKVAAVGHRVVHGGRDFTAPVRLTPGIVSALGGLTPLAPLHQPHCLEPVRVLMATRPALPQVACFDTAFHHTLSPVATRFALPRDYEAEGVRRYGFHGLSYEYIARTLRQTAPALASGRVVAAHLGNGASLCAMRGGVSVDTTMGFTALDGLMMGTRCGSIDAGVVLYMLQQKGLNAEQVEQLLYRQSGLLGVSGVSADVRVLLASPTGAAREAIELFVFRVARETAALAASMGGIDGFVFTGGIGENAVEIRTMVIEALRWMGPLDIRVIPTDEEAMIAIHAIKNIA